VPFIVTEHTAYDLYGLLCWAVLINFQHSAVLHVSLTHSLN